VALLASWLIGPALGLGVVAEEGLMPPLFSRRNGKGSPTGVMILQAVIGTIISLLYVFVPSVSNAYWVLSALTVLLLCIVYMFVFAAVIKLRYSQPDVPRAFRIPGGTTGVWIVGGLGLVATAFTFFVSLIPTGEMNVSVLGYMALMLFGTALLALPPLVFMKMKKPSWKPAAPLTEEPAAAPESSALPVEQKEA
jgi:glutamate:GABA antiporter